MSRRNPRLGWQGRRIRPRHRGAYYTANVALAVSPAVKQGLIGIAEYEGRSLSWVVSEVLADYFRLEDDTPQVLFAEAPKLRRVR